MGTPVDAHLGDVLPFEALRSFAEPKALVDHLRRVTYAVARDRTTRIEHSDLAGACASA
jgi:hypothetical protein